MIPNIMKYETYFSTICRSRTEISFAFSLIVVCNSLILFWVKIVFFGLTSSKTKGLPFPNILTSESSLPDDENRMLSQWKMGVTCSDINSCTEPSPLTRFPFASSQGDWLTSREYLQYRPNK